MGNGTAKNDLRKRFLLERAMLLPNEVTEKSQKIMKRLWQLEPIKKANVIMMYNSIKNEVNLQPFIEEQVQLGKTVLLPRVEEDILQAVQFHGWAQCQVSGFGIKEPLGQPYSGEGIDVVLVPGVAFDGKGYRLGYGKGYYDRFLRRLTPATFLCGISYEFQIVDTIFPDENDVPLHWIVSDQSEVAVDLRFF